MSSYRPDSETYKSQAWNNPQMLLGVERGRYPYQRALRKIVSDVFSQYIPENNPIFEVGAGTGYLKTLVPEVYHTAYVSSDYSIANLKSGQRLRELTIQQASAYELPLNDGSQAAIVNMDAYDTLHNLRGAMGEVARVLSPGGKFIHFQVNYPSDDTVDEEYPDHIFLPARFDIHTRIGMVGVQRADLQKGLGEIKTPVLKPLIQRFLDNPDEAAIEVLATKEAPQYIDMLHEILDAMNIDRVAIPSLPDYFRTKLEKMSSLAGLEILESRFRGVTLRVPRSRFQMVQLDKNVFSMEQGSNRSDVNMELTQNRSTDIIEKASILVFVAQKTEAA